MLLMAIIPALSITEVVLSTRADEQWKKRNRRRAVDPAALTEYLLAEHHALKPLRSYVHC